MPRSTRNGAPMHNAMSRGVTKRKLSQLVPSSAIRSPRVRPIACVETKTHFARVGAPAESEMKAKKSALDDAISATKAAVAEGIVPGGGLALLRAIGAVDGG